MTPTIGSLFDGIGGFPLAFERNGFECKWSVEIDKDCQRVLSRHWPTVPKFLDVKDVGAHNLTPVDVITFGSPCQDLSIAGKREGLEGARSNLFYEAIRIVGELRPTFALWENVPGAHSSSDGRDFAAVLRAFQELGARDICWRTLDAQHFGVPQRRRRIFLIADFAGERAGEILFESESVFRDSAASRKAGQGTAAHAANGTGSRREIVAALTADGVGTCGADDNQAQAGHLLVPVASTLQGGGKRGWGIGAEDAVGGHKVPTVYQCHGNNAGPMGTLPQGNGGLTGGVPFVADDVARCLTSSNERLDPEFENFVIKGAAIGRQSQHGPQYGEILSDGTVYALNATEQHAVAFVQNSRDEVRLISDDGQVVGALGAEPGMHQQNFIAFDWQSGGDVQANISTEGTSALQASQTPAVMAFDTAQITSNVNRTRVEPGLPSSTRASNSQMHVAIEEGTERIVNTLRANAGAPKHAVDESKLVNAAYGVRRLTPMECSRLQGYPDDWCSFDASGNPIADSAQYRMLGNSVAVPVVEWLAERMYPFAQQESDERWALSQDDYSMGKKMP